MPGARSGCEGTGWIDDAHGEENRRVHRCIEMPWDENSIASLSTHLIPRAFVAALQDPPFVLVWELALWENNQAVP